MQSEAPVTRVAAIQMASGPNVVANLSEAGRLISEAAAAGARLVVLPENFALMGMTEADKLAEAEEDGRGPLQAFLAEQAQRHGLWLVGGTIPIVSDDPNRVFGSSLLFSDLGERVVRYDKIHLFDVQLPEGEESYNESETTAPGDRAVVVETPFGRLGIAVCYDLRFPELFRRYALEGARMVIIPAEWPLERIEHWRALMIARAIENQCYMVAVNAAGQTGDTVFGGHSMIVDPWGKVVVEAGESPALLTVEIEMDLVGEVRRRIPVFEDRNPGTYEPLDLDF
jgi:deaminated glutathione amidase